MVLNLKKEKVNFRTNNLYLDFELVLENVKILPHPL